MRYIYIYAARGYLFTMIYKHFNNDISFPYLRLVFYDKYDNFGHNQVESDDIDLEKVIVTPSALLYKDLNSSDPVPKLSDVHIDEYLNRYNVNGELYTTNKKSD